MNDRPEVSIVIPTYNQADFLREAIKSVIDQTYYEWELIIVNNFSEDDTIPVVESFSDPRIRLVNYRNHGVIAASRNEGIRLSNSEVIAFLDSDDIWYPEKLSLCMQYLNQGADLVSHGLHRMVNGSIQGTLLPGPNENATFLNLLYEKNCLATSAIIIRKECLTKVGCFDESEKYITAEDYDLWLKLAHSGVKTHLTNIILGKYRMHYNSASKATLRNANAVSAVIEKHFLSRTDLSFWERLRVRRRRALVFYGAARSFQQAGQKMEALTYFAKCIMKYPFLIKSYLALCFIFFKR